MTRRQLTCFAAALALGLGEATAAASEMAIVAPTTSVPPNGVQTIAVTLQDSPGVLAMEFDVLYDPDVLEITEIRPGEAARNMLVDVGHDTPGLVIVNMATSGNGPRGDAVLIELKARAKGSLGQSSKLALANARAWDEKESLIPIREVAGEIRIGTGLPWVWIALGVGACLLLLLLGLAMRRKRSAGTSSSPTPPAAAACAKCGAACHAGTKFCPQCGSPLAGAG